MIIYLLIFTINMKLFLFSPYKKSGGVASFVENILPFFTYPVRLFYRGKKENANRYWSYFQRIITPFRYIISMIQYMPDKVIVNTSLSLGGLLRDGILIVISKLFHKKVFLIIHGFQEEALKYNRLLKWGYFNADSIIVLAKSFSEILLEVGYNKAIYTQWNPVSLEILEAFDKNSQAKVNNAINILFLARIEEAKGIFTSIEAFKIIQKSYPNVFLNIAGSGQALYDAQKLAENLNVRNINFHGFVSGRKKIDLLKLNHILLFPTTHREGLPINVLEAMASGQIIVTRPVGGLVDLFNTTNFGYLINSKEPVEFAQAIIKIIENKEMINSKGKSNAQFAVENFHPQSIVSKVENIIEVL